jgi:hypothetical protein
MVFWMGRSIILHDIQIGHLKFLSKDDQDGKRKDFENGIEKLEKKLSKPDENLFLLPFLVFLSFHLVIVFIFFLLLQQCSFLTFFL